MDCRNVSAVLAKRSEMIERQGQLREPSCSAWGSMYTKWLPAPPIWW